MPRRSRMTCSRIAADAADTNTQGPLIDDGMLESIFGPSSRTTRTTERTETSKHAIALMVRIRDALNGLGADIVAEADRRGIDIGLTPILASSHPDDRDRVRIDVMITASQIEQAATKLRAIAAQQDEPDMRIPIPRPAPLVDTVDEQRTASLMADTVGEEAVRCLECGRNVVLLKSHLRKVHSLDWKPYLRRWRLPESYPSTPARYADEQRDHAMRANPHSYPRWRRRNGLE